MTTDAFPALPPFVRIDVRWMEAPARTASATHWATLRVYPPAGEAFARDAFTGRIGEAFMIRLAGSDVEVILRDARVASDGAYADLIVGALPALPGNEEAPRA
jgi:hypothetical protein